MLVFGPTRFSARRGTHRRVDDLLRLADDAARYGPRFPPSLCTRQAHFCWKLRREVTFGWVTHSRSSSAPNILRAEFKESIPIPQDDGIVLREPLRVRRKSGWASDDTPRPRKPGQHSIQLADDLHGHGCRVVLALDVESDRKAHVIRATGDQIDAAVAAGRRRLKRPKSLLEEALHVRFELDAGHRREIDRPFAMACPFRRFGRLQSEKT